MKKKKIIKAQLGRIIKDNLSPQQRMQLDTYKKTVVDERSNKESERRDQEQKDFYRKRFEEYQARPKYRAEPMPSIGEEMEEPRRERMPSSEMEELSRMLIQEKENAAAEAAAQGAVGEALGRKKGGMTKAQKKVGTVMREFKAGKLHSGKKGPVVKSSKQAIAIALSEAGKSKKKMMGGMMSDGVSRKGMGVEKRMGGGMMSDGVANKGSGIEMKSKGGMVRGQGAAIRGTKFKGIF
jgi:hypothetical protein